MAVKGSNVSKYNKKTALILLQTLAAGETKVESSRVAGISYKTYFDWYNEHQEFKDAVDEILLTREVIDKEAAISAIQGAYKAGTWVAAAWWLERKYPEEFALRKSQLELSGTIEHKQLLINVIDNETKLLMDNAVKLIDMEGNEII